MSEPQQKLMIIPRNEWNSLRRAISKIEKKLDVEDMISEEEACRLLGREGKPLQRKTLTNYIDNGRIPPSCYTTAITGGAKFFFKTKLMGLK